MLAADTRYVEQKSMCIIKRLNVHKSKERGGSGTIYRTIIQSHDSIYIG